MEGGTTFHFVTGGIEKALGLAMAAAGDKDVKIGGGVSTIQRFLKAGLIDSLRLASVPVLLGRGEPLFDGLDLQSLGFSVTDRKVSEYATPSCWKGLKEEADCVANSIRGGLKLLAAEHENFQPDRLTATASLPKTTQPTRLLKNKH